jgi:RNA polymerase sigma factor (sigma-70 family)
MNTTHNEGHSLPAATMRYIDLKTRQTSVNVGLSFADEDDLRQHISLAVVKARYAFDEAAKASLETFLHTAVDNAVKEFLRNKRREKRVRLLYVLDEPVCQDGFGGDDEAGCEESRIDTIADERDGGIADIDLHNEVQDALRGLDAQSLQLCQLLMDGETLRGAAAKMGITHWRVIRSLMPKIAVRLQKIRDFKK